MAWIAIVPPSPRHPRPAGFPACSRRRSPPGVFRRLHPIGGRLLRTSTTPGSVSARASSSCRASGLAPWATVTTPPWRQRRTSRRRGDQDAASDRGRAVHLHRGVRHRARVG